MGTPSAEMRRRRLEQHGSPALQAAVASGHLTIYRAGEIAKLPAREQEIALAQWTERSLRRTQGHAIAAAVIRRELRNSKVDLDWVLSAIRVAVAVG